MNKTIRLCKLERSYISNGFPYKPPDRTITGYRFDGMPPNQEAFTSNFGSHLADSEHVAYWKVLRVIDGIAGEWTGGFRTPDEAQAALEVELERESAGAVM